MSGIQLRRLYIDTKFKTADSKSNSDFKFQLQRSAFMPPGSMFAIDEKNVPHSWNTIERNVNDAMYVGWRNEAGGYIYNIITIPSKRYDGTGLALQMQAN